MVFGWDDAIGAAMSIGGNLLGGAMTQSGQASANSNNIALARENMAWQEHMSNTAYQRVMADMRAAGLNPILAYQKGGASTPGMAMPDMKNEMGGWGPALSGAVSSAQSAFKTAGDYKVAQEEAKKIPTQADLNKAQTALTEAGVNKTNQETITSATQAELNRAAALTQTENAANMRAQNIILGHEGVTAKHISDIRGREAADRIKYGDPTNPLAKYGPTVERVLDRIGGSVVPGPGNPRVPRLGQPTHGFTWGVREPTSLKLPTRN